MTIDPVCKMQVTIGANTPSADYEGEHLYFCSQHCKEEFQAAPIVYIKPKVAMAEKSGVIYTCPMHPEIRLPSPGNCPRCGMALQEESPVAVVASFIRPFQLGTGASILMLAIYFGVVSLISGLDFASEQFIKFWYFMVPLVLGFGIQVGLYTYLANLVGKHGVSGKVVALSGTTSTAAMVSCCAHYLVNILPVLGVTGFLTVITEYQIELFWLGLAFNAAGILYVASKVVQASKEHKKCAHNS